MYSIRKRIKEWEAALSLQWCLAYCPGCSSCIETQLDLEVKRRRDEEKD